MPLIVSLLFPKVKQSETMVPRRGTIKRFALACLLLFLLRKNKSTRLFPMLLVSLNPCRILTSKEHVSYAFSGTYPVRILTSQKAHTALSFPYRRF
jgi:hypothetical protein